MLSWPEVDDLQLDTILGEALASNFRRRSGDAADSLASCSAQRHSSSPIPICSRRTCCATTKTHGCSTSNMPVSPRRSGTQPSSSSRDFPKCVGGWVESAPQCHLGLGVQQGTCAGEVAFVVIGVQEAGRRPAVDAWHAVIWRVTSDRLSPTNGRARPLPETSSSHTTLVGAQPVCDIYGTEPDMSALCGTVLGMARFGYARPRPGIRPSLRPGRRPATRPNRVAGA